MSKFLKKLSRELIHKFVMPSRGVWLADHKDMHKNWDYCKDFYGNEFNMQLVTINRKTHNVWLPPISSYKELFIKYLQDDKNYFDIFKTQYLLNDYLTTGLKFPAQAVWNWRMNWWEIHPGYLRGLVYNLLDVQEWTAWYQPMVYNNIEYTEKFNSVKEVLEYFTGYETYDAELTDYFGKPLLNMNLYIASNTNKSKEHQTLFYKNIENGFNVVGDNKTIESVKKEIMSWPKNNISDAFVFNSNNTIPTITLERFDKNIFYPAIYFAGTKLKEFNNNKIVYFNQSLSV